MASTPITSEVVAEARDLIDQGASQREVAAQLGVSQSGLSVALRRVNGQAAAPAAPCRPGAEIRGDEATVTGYPSPDLGDADHLLASRGLDPDEWEVTKAVVNEWGRDPDTGGPYRQLKVWLRRRVTMELVRPAVHVPRATRPRHARSTEGPRSGVVLTDPHCPYEDPALDRCVESFLADHEPDFGVLGGDVLDLPTISRHRKNPAYDASPQECVQSGYEWLRRKVEASPDTRWTLLLGNHDIRLRDYHLDQAERTYGLAPASVDGTEPEPESAADFIRRVLHLDALGIDVEAPAADGAYTKAQANVTRTLGVIHGDTTGQNPGRRIMAKRGHSVIFGHDHSKSTSYLTRYDMDGHKQLVAVGAGTLARIEDGLGYCEHPDWQQGFATVTTWPDGTFNAEHAVYTAGALYWRDRRWK